MGSPARSLHVAAAVPATSSSVAQPYLCRDTPQKAISVSCCTSSELAVNTPRRCYKQSRATGFAFLCSPPRLFPHSTWKQQLRKVRGGEELAYFAFPHQLGLGIACGCSIGFVLAEDLFEEAVLHEA
jgi:hypothetical protein